MLGRAAPRRLHREPLVDHERFVLEAAIEIVERAIGGARRVGRRGGGRQQRDERARAVGHVVRGVVLRGGEPDRVGRLVEFGEVGEREVLQRAAARVAGRRRIRARRLVALVDREPLGAQRRRELAAHELARAMDGGRIGLRHLVGEVGLRRQRERELAERGRQRVVRQHALERGGERVVERERLLRRRTRREREQRARREALARLPAVERIAVVREQERELVVAVVVFDDHGRGEIAQQRRQRRRVDVDERERRLGLGQLEHARRARRGRFAFEAQRQIAAVGADQADRERDQERPFLRVARGGRGVAVALPQRHRVALRGGVVSGANRHARRARLAVPALEQREVAAVRVGHRVAEVVARDGLPVVAPEVQVHPLAETVAAEQRLVHPHDFRAFFVDGHRIEVVDLDVTLGPHRMGHRARVLGELELAQHAHVLDALDRARGGVVFGARGHVRRELLVAEHGEAFLQAQLEPVAAGHAVARPVVEILVADDRFDVREVDVGRRLRVREHVLRVEDVEPLVFHRAHVEIADGDDHEAVEIELEAEAPFVPADRMDQRIHRVAGLAEILRLDPHLQELVLAARRLDRFLELDEFARDECEQVARLLERVFPLREVTAVRQIAGVDEIAVRQQHRVRGLVGAQRDRVRRHHVRTVDEVGDAPKALRLALREEVAARYVQARQRRVRLGRACVLDRQLERIGHVLDAQAVFVHAHRVVRLAVDARADQHERFAHQLEVRCGRGVRVAAHAHRVRDDRARRLEIELERDGIDQERRRRVVAAADLGVGSGDVGHGDRGRWKSVNTRRCGGAAAKGHCTKPLRKARATNFSAAPTVFSISARRLRDGV
ncbi:Uncharacterised protein [Burkholderia pseudomallei]|nr:Uncharacterised protein [Burkholderia pseudomallei]